MKPIKYVDYKTTPNGYEFTLEDGSIVVVPWNFIVLPKQGEIALTGGTVIEK